MLNLSYSHIFNSVGPTLIIAPPPHPTHSTAPAHWRTRRRSNEIARMGLPEITDHQLDLKLPTPLGTQVTASRPGALLWQNANICTRLCAACGCDIKKKSNSNFPTVQLSRKCGSSASRFTAVILYYYIYIYIYIYILVHIADHLVHLIIRR